MKIKKRLDVLLTEQGYADSRAKAQAIIMSGLVYVNGQKADKSGVSYEESVTIEVRGASCRYVSRGGLKLEKALEQRGSCSTPIFRALVAAPVLGKRIEIVLKLREHFPESGALLFFILFGDEIDGYQI